MGEQNDDWEPEWVKAGLKRKMPYTEAELDRFVADFIRELDAPEWQAIKNKYGGEAAARERIRAGFIRMDENNLVNIAPDGPIH